MPSVPLLDTLKRGVGVVGGTWMGVGDPGVWDLRVCVHL